MSNFIVMSFDLSSVCTGVTVAALDGKKILKIKSCPIIPPKFNPEELGYLKTKRKISSRNKIYNSYVKFKDEIVTMKEKKHRDIEVRNASNLFAERYIGEQITKLVDYIKPNLIIVEKNEIFNGVLTSVFLGKIMGVLVGIASSKNIPLKEYKVKLVRSIINIFKCTSELVGGLSEEEVKNIPDVTKRALRTHMEKKYGKYGLKCSTDDEGDSCVVFNYWYETECK